MNKKTLIAVTCVLLSGPLAAQAGPVVEKSAAEITCELSGDCDAFSQEPTRDATGDRGFNLRLPGKSAVATGPANRSASSRPVIGGSYSPATSGRSVTVAGKRSRTILRNQARNPAVQPGRSSLAIGFASGSDTLTDSGLSQARKLLESIRQPSVAGKRLLVAGHTDSVGTRERNLELSRRRADTLVKFLVENGVDPARLEAKGFGLNQPISGTNPSNGANRRVEIVVIN